jgi:hypothetical protein
MKLEVAKFVEKRVWMISCFALFFGSKRGKIVFRVGRGGVFGVCDAEARFSGYHPLRLDCVQISRVSDSKSTEEQEKKRGFLHLPPR